MREAREQVKPSGHSASVAHTMTGARGGGGAGGRDGGAGGNDGTGGNDGAGAQYGGGAPPACVVRMPVASSKQVAIEVSIISTICGVGRHACVLATGCAGWARGLQSRLSSPPRQGLVRP